MRLVTISLVALALCLGCQPSPTQEMKVSGATGPVLKSQERVVVERIGVVEDDLAYNERRGIYLIRDTKTGVEYIGVSGVGITETGSHCSGKSTFSDER